jgi:DNA-binding beta-propeller fold protein YncE
VWLANRSDDQFGANHSGRLTEFDPVSGSVRAGISLGGVPRSLAVSPDAVWVAAESGVWRVDPGSQAPVVHVRIPDPPLAVAADNDAVWVVTRNRTLRRIDPGSNTVVETLRLPYTPYDVAVSKDAVWVSVGIRD